MEEEKELAVSEKHQPRVNFSGQTAEAVSIQNIKVEDIPRIATDMEEVNHVLGGGIVPGSMILIGGDPGIGKSTLLLQVSAQINNKNIPVLYVSGEESASQIKLRAERLGVKGADFYIYPETDIDAIAQTIERLKPELVIIDSIQTMVKADNDSTAGSVSQVRESTQALMRIAKTNNISIFIVGHVTKEGNIAGPRMLEHMVDTVLYFEGDRHHTFRIYVPLRTVSAQRMKSAFLKWRKVAYVKSPTHRKCSWKNDCPGHPDQQLSLLWKERVRFWQRFNV